MGWYYVITQEMRELLEGKEVDVYAVINGFSQEGQGCFYGSLSNLSKYCGIKSKTTTSNVLKSLLSKGLITKTEGVHNGVKYCTYTATNNWQGISKIDMGGMSAIDHNNKSNEYVNNTLSNKGQARFQAPSVDEVAAYCAQRGNSVDAEQFVAFYTSKGWKVGNAPMKDWRACVITWEKRDNRPSPNPSPRRQSQQVKRSATGEMMDRMRRFNGIGTNPQPQEYDEQ